MQLTVFLQMTLMAFLLFISDFVLVAWLNCVNHISYTGRRDLHRVHSSISNAQLL